MLELVTPDYLYKTLLVFYVAQLYASRWWILPIFLFNHVHNKYTDKEYPLKERIINDTVFMLCTWAFVFPETWLYTTIVTWAAIIGNKSGFSEDIKWSAVALAVKWYSLIFLGVYYVGMTILSENLLASVITLKLMTDYLPKININ